MDRWAAVRAHPILVAYERKDFSVRNWLESPITHFAIKPKFPLDKLPIQRMIIEQCLNAFVFLTIPRRNRMAKAKKKTTTKKVAKKTITKKAAAPKKAKATKRKPNAAFMKPLTPSAALAEVVGSSPLPRTQVVKKLWDYIKKNKLQDPKNKRNINPDAKLAKVFGSSASIDMFKMTSKVSKHLKEAEAR